ncbi:MAG: bleomycin resistance protein [Proteobacteria bacterium]|nr:MAG: bleomycin resistance protein [Pseudomonadota bacterium]
MAVRGPLAHIDLSVGDPDRSIPFYAALLGALGCRRVRSEHAEFAGERPRRATWAVRHAGGAELAIEVRPARPESRSQRCDRYAPGLHHLAFHAESRAAVDEIHARVAQAGGTVLDAPADYSGQDGYGEGYYAAFFADPDGAKLEVVHEPRTNP